MSRSRRTTTTEMVATKSKRKVLSCSTPDRTLDSPSRDSDSMCDSETASPVPFLCTQEGSDVVWNYYGTNSKTSHPKNLTPVSKKQRKPHRLKLPEKRLHSSQPKRKGIRYSQKKAQLPAELLELNQYVDKLMEKSKPNQIIEKPHSGSEEDIFTDATDCSPRSKNVPSSRLSKPDAENGLESDDSINECLLTASQAVEERILNKAPKQLYLQFNVNPDIDFKMNDDSMDSILRSIKSPHVNKLMCESPRLKNDSFDNLVGSLNDSALERLSQMPVINGQWKNTDKAENCKVAEVVVNNSSPLSKHSFTRHKTMPESPSISAHSRPSTSKEVTLWRYNSMPYDEKKGKHDGDSPIRCTPIEIQKKHQQAREKLLAKRLLPFTQTQQTSQSQLSQAPTQTAVKKPKFQMKVPTSAVVSPRKVEIIQKPEESTLKHNSISSGMDLRSLIEKKRQEALMKLRRRQLQK